MINFLLLHCITFKYINILHHSMVVKTITITEKAYNELARIKAEGESFTELFLRLAKRRPLRDFYGILSKEAAEDLRKSIKEGRELRRPLEEARQKRILSAFNR